MFGGDRCWTREAGVVKNENVGRAVADANDKWHNGSMGGCSETETGVITQSVSRRVPACLFFLPDFGQIMSSIRPPLSSVPVENRHDGS